VQRPDENRVESIPRRAFLAQSLAAGSCLAAWPAGSCAAPDAEGRRLPRVASINSIYRFRSHAYHIGGRFIHGYSREGFHHQPAFQLVRMYNDQFPENDLSREVCKRHEMELSPTVAAALGGSKNLDVDAVLLIVEHGDYPVNALGQILYPRYELYQQVVEVFRSSGRSVPVFIDKHLSYDHRRAAEMVQTARTMGFGLMAGSSLPVTWRRPELEPPLDTPFREGLVCFGYDGGPVEIYLFHALEALAVMLERRAGGETGVRSVTALSGKDVWRAGDEGRWSWKLLKAALARSPTANVGDVRENVTQPIALLVEYRDGTQAAVLNLPEQTADISFAGQIAGRDEPVSTTFCLPGAPGARFFDALVGNIEKFFATGRPPYPVERTLLTSTMLDLGLRSLHSGSSRMESPALDIRYQPPADSGFVRGRFTDAG
jgi:hypothetical protein